MKRIYTEYCFFPFFYISSSFLIIQKNFCLDPYSVIATSRTTRQNSSLPLLEEMAAKCKLEFSDYSKVESEVTNANIHGMVTSLSPIKKSRVGSNYYIGQVCDGKQKLRFIGFSTTQQKQLNEMKEKKQSVELQNCQIKKYIRDSDKLEVFLKGATKILPSTKQFDVSPLEYDQDKPKEIMLSAIDDLPTHTIVTAKVKVANCSTPVNRGRKKKQDVTITDKSGTSVVQLWKENIGYTRTRKKLHFEGFSNSRIRWYQVPSNVS